MTKQDDQFRQLESTLSGVLKGVRPSERFVGTVREKLRYQPPLEIEYPQRERDNLLLTLGGVLVVSFMALTLARGFYHLFRRG
ncbi:MAG TPA: hypothetical protein VN226_07840 [Anaerolineales bacterium]|nr:hypothetical protein [Anaerolineales bacterium]